LHEFKFHVPSDREIRRLLLSGLIADIHKRSRGTYGMLRIRAALMREQGMVVNKKLIHSIMRELGIQGLPGPKKHKKNLVNEATEEDLVQRNFTVDRPNVLWLTDITEHPTAEGKVYCCVVLDAWSRRVVGWAIDRRCETALVNDAVAMAAESRKSASGSIIHSDHGSQYTSWGFSELIRSKGLMGSMGTKGDCYDNAPMESFWGTMQIELLNRKKWRTKIELSIAMAEWIEHFYNPERLHSSLGYVPPVEFEELHAASTQA
jgi:putative transposase